MPAALLAFANDWIDDKRHLRSLLEEGKAIVKALAPVARAGLDVLPASHNATVGDGPMSQESCRLSRHD